MLRPIVLLNLPEPIRRRLQALGYEYIEDIENVLSNTENLSARVKQIFDEHKIADKIVSGNLPYKIVSGTSLWYSELYDSPVAVFHKGLDKLLSGGLPVGRITELCGPPGCGKTQMCLQFCADVQIPPDLGGSGGEALYISTDCGFSVERLKEIMQASIQHCHSIEFPTKKKKEDILKNFTLNTLLNGVNVLETDDLRDLIKALKNLKTIVESNPKMRLLIIDSFSFPLVVEVKNLLLRTKIISEMMDVLLNNAIKYKFAVVLTNQLTTFITRKKAVLNPSLGQGFAHRLHQRLLLNHGKIFLTKSVRHPQMYTRFEITKDGIR